MDLAQDRSVLVATLTVTVFLLQIGLRVAALGIIPHNRKPSSASAWLILVFIEPIVGLVVYRLFGSTRLGRERHQRHEAVNRVIAERTHDLPRPLDTVPAAAYVRGVAALNRRLGALPVTDGNRVDLVGGYDESLQQMAAEIEGAERFVHVEFYILCWDERTAPVFDALERATARGVTVRLLFDHLGTRGIPGYRQTLRRLGQTDIDWHPMLPIDPLRRRWRRPDLRNHRKILVVDGQVAFTGSQNLTEPGYNKPRNHRLGRAWKELMLRVEGPSVAALDAVFAGDWYVETGEVLTVLAPTPVENADGSSVLAQVLPSGPGFVAENNLRMFTSLVYGARRRLSLTSPYFVPDESLLYAVTTAAQRGVDVELFVSEISDQFAVGHAQASYYQALLDSGVRIWLYPPPAILHAKHLSVDDEVGVVGSSNMDMRSFALNYEVSVMLLGSDVVQRLREVEDGYRAVCRRLTPEEWAQRSTGLRYVDNVMRLTAALQ